MTASIHRPILFAGVLFGLSFAPPAASAKTLELVSIRAFKTQESDGDELQLRVVLDNKAPIVYSRSMKTGNVWPINQRHGFVGKMEVGLFEMDGTVSQSLGNTLLNPSVGPHVLNFTAGGIHYRMEYKIHPNPAPTYVLRLNWIHTHALQETRWPDAGDELQLRITADGKTTRLDRKITRKYEVWDLKRDIVFTKSVSLSLYEIDTAIDDYIDGVVFTPKDVGKTYITEELAGDGARYILSYSVFQR